MDLKRLGEISITITAVAALVAGTLKVFGSDEPPYAGRYRVDDIVTNVAQIAETQKQTTSDIRILNLGQATSAYLGYEEEIRTDGELLAKTRDPVLRAQIQKQIDFATLQRNIYQRTLQAAAKSH